MLREDLQTHIYTSLTDSFNIHLRSAPKIFNAVADVIRWMLKAMGVTHLAHYLDDFILLGKAGMPEEGTLGEV